MYCEAVPLRAGKTVQAVVLPNVSPGAAQNTIATHIFAMGVSKPAATTVISLRAHANGEHVTAET
ncbi:MAG: hypothetical protein ACRDVE_15810 [Actinocrinis sp.]